MNELILKNICDFYEKYTKTLEYDIDIYWKLLQKMFHCTINEDFEKLLYEAIDIIKRNKKRDKYVSSYRAFIQNYSKEYKNMDVFSIVFLKNKSLLPVLKKHDIKCYGMKYYDPPIYKPLIERDIETVDFLMKNGYDIIDEVGIAYYDTFEYDGCDMVERLVIEKNTTSIRYIYENVPLENIIEHEKWSYSPKTRFVRYVYDHILPY